MRSSIKFAAVAATAALSIAVLSACSSSSSSTAAASSAPASAAASAAPSGSAVGGMTTCDQATLAPEALKAAQAINANNTFETQSVECDNGWAVATGILGGGAGEEGAETDAESNSEGDAAAPQGAPTSFIFEAEGQFWIPKAAADVCGTINGTTYPSDAQIPGALFTAGCLAG
jgi:maltose-binding protein MalE